MSKKLLTKSLSLLTVLSIAFIATACNKSETTSQDITPTPTETIAATPSPEVAEVDKSKELADQIQDAVDKASEAEIAPVTESLESVADYLLENNIISGERTEVAAEMIGAKSGFKYPNSNVEVYEFDMDSDVYKDLVKTNTVYMESFNMTLNLSAVNGKYVLFCEEASNKDDIVKIFNDMK